MTTQYTPILKLALPVTGELSGTWGDIVNDNITSMVEQAIAGLATINTWTANSHTLTTASGTTSEARCAMLVAEDAAGLTAAGEIICPTAAKIYILQNNSTYALTLKTSAGTGVAVPAGYTMFVFCDGVNVVEAVTSVGTLKVGTGGVFVTTILDEDTLVSDSATALATQQSIKAYVDAQVTAQDLDFAGGTGTGSVDLDSQSFTIAGTANEIETSASGQTLTVGIPDAVTLGTPTFTNSPTINALTASQAVFTNGSKVLVSNAITGTGDVVMSTSPTLVTPALGTPASGVVTNLTGTASININGTVGATTANTGTFSSTVHKGATSGTVTIAAPAVAGTQSYTLPSAVPASNGYALTATTAGVMSWSAIAASAGGSTTQVQYNNAGALGGISGFTTDGTRVTASTTIGVGGATPSTSGSGITFPATQSASTEANTLDDYEEGTWTPIAARFTGGNITAVYGASNAGRYTKIGRLVTIECYLDITSVASQGSSLSQIKGLPFTSASSYLGNGAVFFNTAATTVNIVSAATNTGDNCIYLHDSGNSASLGAFDWKAGSLTTTITYSI